MDCADPSDARRQRDVEITPRATPEGIIEVFPPLHTEGCGDFQAMHRDDWRAVRGYAEIDGFCSHMDSLFSFICHFAGLDEHLLSDDCPHFHIDHTVGSVVTSSDYTIAEQETVSHIALESILLLCAVMRARGSHVQFNEETWGLAAVDLPFARVTTGDWDRGAVRYGRLKGPAKAGRAPLADMPRLPRAVLEAHLDAYAGACAAFLKTRRAGPVLIFGHGGRGRWHADALARHGVTVNGFVDSHAQADTRDAAGRPVLHPDALAFGGADAPYVLVGSMYADEISEQLRARGAWEGDDFAVLY